MKKILCLILAILTVFSCCCTAFATETTEPTQTPLEITKQPVNASAFEGDKATLSVEATGDELSYKWYYRTYADEPYHYYTYRTTSSASFEMSEDNDGWILWCEVKDKYGNKAISETATITLAKPVKITKQPESVMVKAGEKAVVTFNADGVGLSYKWYFKNPGATKFSSTSTFKSNTYTISSMDADRDGRQIYCVVTDKQGNTAKTNTVTISLEKEVTPLKITQQPKNASAKDGKKVSVTVKAQGDGVTYHWKYYDVGDSQYKDSSITTNTYSTTMTNARDSRRVMCVVKDKYGNTKMSNSVTLSMSGIKIIKQPARVAVKKGQTAKVTVKAKGEGLKYQWYFAKKGSTKFSKSSITSATYSVKASSSNNGRQVYCVIKDKYGNSRKTNTVTINMVSMAGKNSVYIPNAGINKKVTLAAMTQANINKYDMVYVKSSDDFYDNNAYIIGHNTGTLKNLKKTKVGQYIYVSVNDKVETYKVYVSEYALQNSKKTDIIGQTTGTSIWESSYDYKILRLSTCHGSNKNGRWMVMAKKIS